MNYLRIGTILTIFLTSYQSLPVDARALVIFSNEMAQEESNTPTQISTSLSTTHVPTTEPNITLTVKPSVSPSNTHTHTPTMAPIKSPTIAPSNTPTLSPTNIPSSEPTTECFFRDDWTFKVNEQPGRGCGWIRNNPYERCLWSTGAKQACAQTCCGINDTIPEPSKLPTAPTLSPSNASTQTSTLAPSIAPTNASTPAPTQTSTISPISAPTKRPTLAPSSIPTQTSTLAPSITPSNAPTPTPTQTSTVSPSSAPTKRPTLAPSSIPTQTLTITPSITPTQTPTTSTSTVPTENFQWLSDAPTYLPTPAPTKGYDPLKRLQYESLPITTSPGGRCMDGTMAGYYIREGNDPNLFVVNMQGGGHCSDPERCEERARSKKGSSRDYPGSMQGSKFLDSDCTKNPRFCHATHVYIPYCTSDLHMGTSEPSNDGFWHSQYYFDGHFNFMAIVDRLVLAEGLQNSPNMKVFLIGNSAGGKGVYFNIDKLKEKIPLAAVKGASEAGWLPISALRDDLPPIHQPSNFTMFAAGLKGNPFYHFIQNGGVPNDLYQMKDMLPADCLDNYEWWACARMNQAYRYIKTPLFHVYTQYDNTQIYSLGGDAPKYPVSNSTIHDVKKYIGMIGRATRAGLQQVLDNTTNVEKNHTDGIFAASCISHGTEATVTIDGGYNWRDIVTDWFFENGQLTDYHRQVELCANDDNYGLPCNSHYSCQYRPNPVVESCKEAMANTGCTNEIGARQCMECAARFMSDILGAGCTPRQKARIIIPEICKDANSADRLQ